jgi:hypothetical protein
LAEISPKNGKIHGTSPKNGDLFGNLWSFLKMFFYVRWHGMSFSDSPQEFSRGALFGHSHIS